LTDQIDISGCAANLTRTSCKLQPNEGPSETYPNYAVERKAGQDFVSSVTRDRDRFPAEVKRASDWDAPLRVLIEEPKRLFKRQQGLMRFRDVAPASLFGTIDSWERSHNVEFTFVGTRERGQRLAFDALSSRLRSLLTSEWIFSPEELQYSRFYFIVTAGRRQAGCTDRRWLEGG